MQILQHRNNLLTFFVVAPITFVITLVAALVPAFIVSAANYYYQDRCDIGYEGCGLGLGLGGLLGGVIISLGISIAFSALMIFLLISGNWVKKVIWMGVWLLLLVLAYFVVMF